LISLACAVIFCAASVLLAALSIRRVLAAQAHWERKRSSTPAIVRWLWAATIACCALTAGMLVAMAVYHLASRRIDGASEGFLSARMALYTGLFGYGIAWLHGRVSIQWPSLTKKGPRLLPPAPDDLGENTQDES